MKTVIFAALIATLATACDSPPRTTADVPQATVPVAVANPPQPIHEPPSKERAELEPTAAHFTKGGAVETATFIRVEPSKVCMVNNQYMASEQIPVVVQGKTYFGCCQMCEAKLANEPSSREATDPVSGKAVDKAVAVIGKDASGAVQYFENEQNFETYASR